MQRRVLLAYHTINEIQKCFDPRKPTVSMHFYPVTRPGRSFFCLVDGVLKLNTVAFGTLI